MSKYTPRMLRVLSKANRDRAHIRHAAEHFIGVPVRTAVPEWDGGFRTITLGGPWKSRDVERIKTAWGIPAELHELDALVHLYAGGWGAFNLPRTPDVYAFMSKAAKHPDAIAYLVTLAQVSLHSMLTLSESLALILDCATIDPLQDEHPGTSANEWARVGVHAINVWQKRAMDGGAGIGDELMCDARLRQLKSILASRQIAQAEHNLMDMKKRWAA